MFAQTALATARRATCLTATRIRQLVLALALLGAMGASLAESAVASTGPGWHTHGTVGCLSGGKLAVYGPQVGNAPIPGYALGPGTVNTITYRAYLHKWNGSSWVYQNVVVGWSGPVYPRGYTKLTLPTLNFWNLSAGHYRVSTEIQWYAYSTAGNTFGKYIGNSSGWTEGGTYCTFL